MSGAFTQRIQLDIPPGRNGLQPDVALQYNSQNTADSIVGYGWSLSIPHIQRVNKTGSQDLFASTTKYFTSSIDGELISQATSTAATTTASVLDTLPVTFQTTTAANSISFTYTVPSGGTNKLLVTQFCLGGGRTPTLTQNGVNVPLTQISGSINRCYHWYGTLANPTSGTFNLTWTGSPGGIQVSVMTLQNAALTSSVDVSNVTTVSSASVVSSISTNATTTVGNDLLLDEATGAKGTPTHTYGAGQTETHPGNSGDPFGKQSGSYKAAAGTAGTETMTRNFAPPDDEVDLAVIAVKGGQSVQTGTSSIYAARVDAGSANSYTFSGNSWTVYDKNGTRYLFGSDDTGRLYDTAVGTSTDTYKWMLQEIRDTNNNYVKFTYLRDYNELYPYQIIYTGNGSTDGSFKATFATSTRPDIRVSYASGFKVTTNNRISEIDALINSTTVRKYLLSYGAGINGKRSLLTSLQEQGYDENNTLTTLPAMTFTYASSTSQFATPSASGHEVNGQIWQVADTNGNGINDVNKFYLNGGINSSMYIDQTTQIDTVHPIEYWGDTSGPLERGVRYIDVNADGKADLVRGWKDDVNGGGTYALYSNAYSTTTNTYSWEATTTLAQTTFAFNETSKIITGGIFGDVNGDGLPDYEVSLPGYQTPTTLLGNGSGWDATQSYFSTVQDFPTTASTATSSQLVDLNGDRLDDWLYSDGTSTFARLNTATGWATTSASQWTIGTSSLYKATSDGNWYDRGIRFLDLNGDGLTDFVRAYKVVPYTACGGVPNFETADVKFVMLNTGNGWATSSAYTLPAYIATGNVPGAGCWDGSFSWNEYANWTGNGQLNQDVLTTVTNSKGGSTSVTYTQSTQLNGKNPELPYSLLVVTAVGIYDGRGNAATTTYSYSGGKQYTSLGVRDRKFAGFASTTITAPDAITNSYFSQGVGTNTALGEQADGYAQINYPFRKDIFDLSGNLVQKTFYRWDTATSVNRTFVNLGRQVTQDYAASGSHRDTATDYLYSSTTNNLIKATSFGEVTGNSDGTFTDTGTDKRIASTTYAASSTANLFVPIQTTLLDYNNATSSDQKLYYDGLAFGSLTKGNNTKEEAWISGSTYASSTKTYNSYGLVSSSTDRRGKLTSNIIEVYNLYVASSTNPLSQQTQFTYDYSVGKVKQTTDPNSRLTRNLYDGVGRLREIGQSDVTTPSTISTTTKYTYTDASTLPSTVKRSDYLTSTTTVDTYSYYDGLARLIQERKMSQYSNVFTASDRVYNLVGKLASSSLPYFSSGSSNTSASTQSLLYTNFTYDALQRPLVASNAVGTTTNVYANWTTTTTDADGNIKDYTRDAFGNLTNVVEHVATLATTTYTWDTLNNLATSTDARDNVRHFTYDGLSRRLTAEDLHYATDTTFGTWSYTYDHAGNMTSQTDPKSQVVNRTYDDLNRMLTEDYTGLAGTEVTNVYDTCTKGIGYICTASSTAASSTSIYDPLGRVATTTITILGIPYASGNAYDLQGNVTTLTYPNNSQVAYWYNIAGLPVRVTRKAPGTSTFSDIVSNIDYGPHSQLVNIKFGNSASTTRAYDPNALYRLSSLQTIGASSTYFQNIAYAYDPVGNILQISNTASTSAKATTAFDYDQLYRLTLAVSTPVAPAVAVMDTLPVTNQTTTGANSISFTYTVPSGGTNKLLVTQFCLGTGRTPTVTQNGVNVPLTQITGSNNRCLHWYGVLANPVSGTFLLSWTGSAGGIQVSVMTLQNAALTSPVDVSNVTTASSAGAVSSISTNVTTTQANTLLLDEATGAKSTPTHTYGSAQTETHPGNSGDPFGKQSGSSKAAAAIIGTETMTRYLSPPDDEVDLAVIAIRQAAASTTAQFSPYQQSYTYDQLGNMLSMTNGATSTASSVVTPSILDTLPVSYRESLYGTSDSFSYTVPSGGSNKLLIVQLCLGGARTPTATQNGASLTWAEISGSLDRCHHWYGYLAAPTSGTFSLSWSGAGGDGWAQYSVMTLQNAAQTNPIDVSNLTDITSSSASISTSVTTTVGNDLLLDESVTQPDGTDTYGSGQTQTHPKGVSDPNGHETGSSKSAAATAGSETMTRIFSPNGGSADLAVIAVKAAPGVAQTATTSAYTYAGTGYANPDAVTQIANGSATTSYLYDNNGNVTQAGIWTYLYDYLNRITSIGGGSSTSTFGYDAMGARVYQAATTSTTTYASKYFSIASTTIAGTSWATTTSYVFLGDTLLATIEQQFKSGTATGTAKTRYVHPDHLNSTNVVTDEGANLVQTLDYYPFGAPRVNDATSTNEQRKYIGQFSDASTNLSYLNARYYDPARGQFVSQDPVFWEIGRTNDGKMALLNPQELNSYGYANDNPITNKDPSGRIPAAAMSPFLLIPAEFAAGVTLPAWAVPVAIGAGVVGGSYLLYRYLSPELALDTSTLHASIGQGWNPDPERPKKFTGRLIGTAVTLFSTGLIANAGVDYFGPMQNTARSAQIYNNYNQWVCTLPTQTNVAAYTQNVNYSFDTLKPSYTAPQSNGTNPGYATQTYRTPSGAVVDWGGSIVVAPSTSGTGSWSWSGGSK